MCGMMMRRTTKQPHLSAIVQVRHSATLPESQMKQTSRP